MYLDIGKHDISQWLWQFFLHRYLIVLYDSVAQLAIIGYCIVQLTKLVLHFDDYEKTLNSVA